MQYVWKSKVVQSALTRGRELLAKHRSILDAIALELISVETMEKDAYEKLLTLHGITSNKKHGDPVAVAERRAPVIKEEDEELKKDDRRKKEKKQEEVSDS